MPCDRKLKPKQTYAQRAKEVRLAGQRIDQLLARGVVTAKVDRRTGGIVFIGIPDDVRNGMTDVCVYNHVMQRGSHAAKQQIAKAQRQAGVTPERLAAAVGSGLHSHDGGISWGRD